jgi:uncharacterized protein (TIGR02646 family)
MIEVSRGDPPPGFASRSQIWNEKFSAARVANPKTSASKFWARVRPEIRDDGLELYRRFNRKCVFCESRVEHVARPHIEHYRPKGREEFQSLMFDWSNWLASCGRCNEKKWKHFPITNGVPDLIDPSSENTAPHLRFVGAEAIGLTARGEETVKMLGLDRMPLRNERKSWLNRVDVLLLLAVSAEDAVKNEVRNHLVWMMQPDAPYTAVTRTYLSSKCPNLANPPQPHTHLSEENRLMRISELVEIYKSQILELS